MGWVDERAQHPYISAMNADDTGQLIYLILLGIMVVGWFVVSNRESMNKTLQMAAIWGLIFLGVVAAVGLWDDIQQTVRPTQTAFTDEGRIEVPRSPDGHYYMTLDINDVPVKFVVDTGASDMVLTLKDAERVGLNRADLQFFGRAMTANGEVRIAPVRLDKVSVGGLSDMRVSASVNEGEMTQSLLGMSYLQRWDRIEIVGDELILTR